MSASRGDGRTHRSERGQSTLMGIVLLIGMVAAGSLGILLVAGDVMNSAEQQSEQERIEQTFIELSHSIASSSAAGDVSQSMELHAGESGAIAHHDSATYRIWTESYNDTGETDDVAAGTIGTIEYEDEDGTRIAYEGGAVFRETGERTQLLSEPAINYDHETSTLSFPVVRLAEEKTIDSGNVNIRQTDVDPGSVNYIQEDHVYVEIESDYCLGWEEYFVDQAGDTSLQEECYGGDNAEGVVRVKLGYDDISDAFSSGVAVPSDDNIDDKHDTFDDIDANKQFQPMDSTITQLESDFSNESAEENGSVEEIDATGTYGSGEYYADELIDPDLTFDLSGGDATLVVDGDIRVDDDGISVSDCGPDGESQLKIYLTGDLAMKDGEIAPDCDGDGSVRTIQIYGTSTTGIDFQSNPTFEGLIYAASDKDPDDDGFDGWPVEGTSNRDDSYQVNFQGANSFEGSLVAHSINVDSNLNGVDDVQPENSETIEPIPTGYEPVPQLTYLNVAEHTIEIENN